MHFCRMSVCQLSSNQFQQHTWLPTFELWATGHELDMKYAVNYDVALLGSHWYVNLNNLNLDLESSDQRWMPTALCIKFFISIYFFYCFLDMCCKITFPELARLWRFSWFVEGNMCVKHVWEIQCGKWVLPEVITRSV